MTNPAGTASPGVASSPARLVVLVFAALSLLPQVSAGVALLAGIVLAQTVGNPFFAASRRHAHRLLKLSVIGLGGAMNLGVVAAVGLHGAAYTALSIALALALGAWLGRLLKLRRDAALLVSAGTAICGGSAIAAVAPVIGAKDEQVSMALVTVFVLNAVALFLFPAVGHALHLNQDQFGLWCALAIHDTSSVIGAASAYGERALEVATAAKLVRALWIVPVTLAIAAFRSRAAAPRAPAERGARPWFIAGFVLLAALVTYVPVLRAPGHALAYVAHRLLGLTLFLIGLGLTRDALRTLGPRSLLQALGLWTALAGGTLLAICEHWLR